MIRSFNSYDKTVIVIAKIAPFIIKKKKQTYSITTQLKAEL